MLSLKPIPNHGPIVMLVKKYHRGKPKTGSLQESEKYRWRVYLWQPPDDLVSWALPANADHHDIIDILRFSRIFI